MAGILEDSGFRSPGITRRATSRDDVQLGGDQAGGAGGWLGTSARHAGPVQNAPAVKLNRLDIRYAMPESYQVLRNEYRCSKPRQRKNSPQGGELCDWR